MLAAPAFSVPNSAIGVASDNLAFTGMVVMGGSMTPASGWLLCDGSAVSRTVFANLFNTIGTNFGIGDGVTTFNLPDLTGRFALGVGTPANPAVPGGTNHAIGTKGGEETHTLTIAETASHDHGAVTGATAPATGAGSSHSHTTPNHAHNAIGAVTYHLGTGGIANRISASLSGGGGVTTIASTQITDSSGGSNTGAEAAHTHTVNSHTHPVTAQGGGGAHNNLPQFTALPFFIKT